MTTLSQISLVCQPPVAISDPQPDTTPLNHLPGGSSTGTPTSNQTQEGVSSYIFGFIDSANLRRKYDTRGRLMHCEITLSEWLWRAIEAHEVLTVAH